MLEPQQLASTCLSPAEATDPTTPPKSLRGEDTQASGLATMGAVSAWHKHNTIHADIHCIFQLWGALTLCISLAVHLRRPWHDLGLHRRRPWCPHRAVRRPLPLGTSPEIIALTQFLFFFSR